MKTFLEILVLFVWLIIGLVLALPLAVWFFAATAKLLKLN